MMQQYISVFMLNGYENLELFQDIEEEDLDYLGIIEREHRAKLITAAELLHDYSGSYLLFYSSGNLEHFFQGHCQQHYGRLLSCSFLLWKHFFWCCSFISMTSLLINEAAKNIKFINPMVKTTTSRAPEVPQISFSVCK